MNNINSKVLVLDVQTSALSPHQGQIIEIGWYYGDDLNPQKIAIQLVAMEGERKLAPRIEKITGISQRELQDQISLDVVWAKLLAELPDTGQVPCIIHFARFEQAFLRFMPSWHRLEVFCSYEMSRRLLPDLSTGSLRGVSGFLGSPIGESKRSRDHVAATMFLWKKFRPILQEMQIADFSQLRFWLQNTKRPQATKKQYRIPREKRLALPDSPGVYLMKNQKSQVLYAGKATSLKNRVNSYFRGRKSKGSRLNEMVAQVFDVEWHSCGSALQAAVFEFEAIKKWDPPYNVAMRETKKIGFIDANGDWSDSWQPLGPISSMGFVAQWLHLRDLINGSVVSLALPEQAQENLQAALEMFRETWKISENWELRQWRSLCLRMWWHWKLFRLQQKHTVKLELSDEEEEIIDLENDVASHWEPETICRFWRHNLVGIGEQLHRARWLKRLATCSLVWQSKNRNEYWHRVHIRDYQIGDFEEIKDYQPDPDSSIINRQAPKIESSQDYKKLIVFFGELKRLVSSNRSLFLTDSFGKILSTKDVSRLLVMDESCI